MKKSKNRKERAYNEMLAFFLQKNRNFDNQTIYFDFQSVYNAIVNFEIQSN